MPKNDWSIIKKMSSVNIHEDTGIPPRYILFASEYSWFATEKEMVAGFDRIAHCIDKAKSIRLPYALIIDRHDPRVPIYLDSGASYEPYEMF